MIITTFPTVIKNVIVYAIWATVPELFKDYLEPSMSGKEHPFPITQ